MPTMSPTKSESVVLRIPNKDNTPPKWKLQLTIRKRSALCFLQHQFPTDPAQGKMVNSKGEQTDRYKTSFSRCLAMKPIEYEGSFDDIEYTEEGLALCRSIRVPDGRSIHDCHGIYGVKNDWTISAFVYNWTDGLYQVLQASPSSSFVRSLYERVWDTEAEPATYMLEMECQRQANGNRTFITMKPEALPGTLPQINPDWKKSMDYYHTGGFETAEAMVQRLGIEQWNPHIIAPKQAAAPPVQAGAVGFDDDSDPFGDSVPAAGSIVGAIAVTPPPPEPAAASLGFDEEL